MDFEKLKNYRDMNNNFQTLLNIKTTVIGDGYAKGEMPIVEAFTNIINSVHGGCIFTLADTIAGAAAISRGELMTTVSSDMHYLNAAIDVKMLWAEAKEVKRGKTLSVIEVDIFDEKDTHIARASFTYYNLRKPVKIGDK